MKTKSGDYQPLLSTNEENSELDGITIKGRKRQFLGVAALCVVVVATVTISVAVVRARKYHSRIITVAVSSKERMTLQRDLYV